jgi:hypothetical protein
MSLGKYISSKANRQRQLAVREVVWSLLGACFASANIMLIAAYNGQVAGLKHLLRCSNVQLMVPGLHQSF